MVDAKVNAGVDSKKRITANTNTDLWCMVVVWHPPPRGGKVCIHKTRLLQPRRIERLVYRTSQHAARRLDSLYHVWRGDRIT